jgi:ribosomal protein S18 acetylase RimI-like enzyme
MIQEPVFYTAKNNQQFEIRTPREDEAQSSLEMMIEVAAHSPYILSTPEMFKQRTTETQVKWFQENATSESAVILAAYINGRMIGFCDGRSYKDIKRKHRASLGLTIHPDFRGCGLGKKMMEILLANMKRFSGIKIIELDVMLNNIPALKMYEGLGFKKAGVFPKAYVLPTGEVSDNLTMFLEV